MTAPDARTTAARAYDVPSAAPVSGPFVWHDLMSTDPGRSVAFYTALFGWRAETKHMGAAGSYTYIHAAGHPFGGVVPLDPKHGIASHWVPYVAVADVDATCDRAVAHGGRACIPPTDIPNVGRFAMIEDPSGAVLSPISLPRGPDLAPATPPAPGTAWWHELASPDPAHAAAFYHAVLGWRVQDAPMPGGTPYWLFLRGDAQAGGMYRLPEPAPFRPHWMIYVTVDDADAAFARAIALGATPMFPCLDVPGTGRIAGFVDPLGATFAIGQPGRS